MKRLLHFLWGHQFTVQSSTFCEGTGRPPVCYTDAAFYEMWGFTELLLICDCGKVKHRRAVGRHAAPTTDGELNALRKMAGI